MPIRDETLAREYQFLRTKFNLMPIDGSLWKLGRIRPQNSPERRIKQFANLMHRSEFLFSRVIDISDVDALAELFAQEGMSRASIDILLINTIIPYKYAYRMQTAQSSFTQTGEHHSDKARGEMELMEQIAPEDNTVIRQWRMLGQQVRNAADTQALLHLYQNYCQHHECVNCEVGYRIFFAGNLFPL